MKEARLKMCLQCPGVISTSELRKAARSRQSRFHNRLQYRCKYPRWFPRRASCSGRFHLCSCRVFVLAVLFSSALTFVAQLAQTKRIVFLLPWLEPHNTRLLQCGIQHGGFLRDAQHVHILQRFRQTVTLQHALRPMHLSLYMLRGLQRGFDPAPLSPPQSDVNRDCSPFARMRAR